MPDTPSILAPTQIQAHIVRRATTKTGEWLHLALKRAPSESIYPNLWQVITGTMEAGETAVQTAFREIEEETGLQPNELWVIPYVGSFFDARNNRFVLVPCFGAIVGTDSVRLSDEHSEYGWLTLDEAMRRFPMPSHKEGASAFYEHILQAIETAPFQRVWR